MSTLLTFVSHFPWDPSERAKSRRRGLKETDRLDSLVEDYKKKFFGGAAAGGAGGQADKKQNQREKPGGGLQRWFE